MEAVTPRAALASVALALVGTAWLANACGGDDAVTPIDAAVDVTPPPPPPPPVDAARPDAAPVDAEADSGCTPDPGPADAGIALDVDAAEDDSGNPLPDAASFALTHALAGYPAVDGVLTARIETELGKIVCKLDEANAPVTVANFVGLARGTRPYRGDGGTWRTGRFYDGLLFHRVVPEFVIQGGDPRGNGTGGPGYAIPNENHAPQDLGVLAMAASQEPDSGEFVPSGSQFYVVVGTGPKPDYNVLGTCTVDVAQAISNVERRSNDRPKVPVHMTRVTIERCPRQ